MQHVYVFVYVYVNVYVYVCLVLCRICFCKWQDVQTCTNTRLSALDLRLDLSLWHLTRQSCCTWARKAIAFSVGAMFLCRLYRPHVVA